VRNGLADHGERKGLKSPYLKEAEGVSQRLMVLTGPDMVIPAGTLWLQGNL
jgi:hypothetical protein